MIKVDCVVLLQWSKVPSISLDFQGVMIGYIKCTIGINYRSVRDVKPYVNIV